MVNGFQANRWSVKERLPEKEGGYLVVVSFMGVELFVDLLKFKEKEFYIDGTPEKEFNPEVTKVTHWMPLPKPPEEL